MNEKEKELFQAIEDQDPGKVQELLKEVGVNVVKGRYTPLIKGIEEIDSGDDKTKGLKIVDLLLEYGADLSKINKRWSTQYLTGIALYRDTDLAKLLLAHGVDHRIRS